MTSTNDIRPRLHGMWAGVVPGWDAYADGLDAGRAELTEAMLDRGDVRPGARVLELACGPGGVGLAAAGRVGPDGEVLCTDAVPEMTAIAARRARERGLANVTTAAMDLETLDLADGSLDVVVCREGLMFALDPRRAAREIHRVLRPGGRAVVAVWGAAERNPWLALMLRAVAEQVDAPVPPPGVPGPFSLGDPDEAAAVLRDGGLVDVVVEDWPAPMGAVSFAQWWDRTTALAGPLGTMLACRPASERDAIRARLLRDVEPYRAADGTLELPGVSLLLSARRPTPAIGS